MECANSGLLLFDRPPTQTDVKSSNDVKYYPVSSISSGQPIEFFVPGSVEEYIECDHIFLEIATKITKKDGSVIDVATDKCGFVNLPISSLFTDVALTIQEKQIEGGDGMYPYKCYFPTLMQFTPQAQNSHMTAMGWTKDEAEKMDDASNKALLRRMSWTDKSKIKTFIGPVSCDFFKQSKYLLSQTDIRLKFRLAEPDFALLCFGTGDYKFDIISAVLHVRRITVSPTVINEHAIGLKTHNAYYPVLHTEMTNFTIPKGQSNFIKDGLYPKKAPEFLMIALVENEAFNGNKGKNPFNFQHFDLSRIGLFSNGVSIPGQPVTPDYANQSYEEAYYRLMDAYHYFNTDDSNGLTVKDFGSGFSIYAFDLTPDKSLLKHCIHPTNLTNLRIEFKFDVPLPTTVNVLLHAVFNSGVEITSLRDVIPEYLQ